MKRKLLLGWMCISGVMLFAQDDPIIMRVNGSEVLRSEFEYSYRRHSADGGQKMSPEEYAELFIDKKLKVSVAKTSGMDTIASFRQKQKLSRSALMKTYFMDELLADSCTRAHYDVLKANGCNEQVQIMQVFKRLSQTIASRNLQAEQDRMDSVYLSIKNLPDVGFAHVVDQISEDKRCVWLDFLRTTKEFEEIAFSLEKGEVSKPFLTPAGIHILKVIDRRELSPSEIMNGELLDRVEHVWSLGKGTEILIEKLKKQYQYASDSLGVEELLAVGETKRTLFTIDDKAFTGEMFKRFAVSYPRRVKKQLDGFIAKSILEYEKQHAESKCPEMKYTILEKEEEALVAQLNYQKIEDPVMNDRVALATYFKLNQSNYQWESPRYRGAVLHCVDKKVAKQAKRLLKKLPGKEWIDIIRKTFNTSGVEKVKIEQGVFALGDNKYVDKLVFKKGEFMPMMSHPFTAVVGHKMKGPDDYQQVIEQLRKDCRTYLDICWAKELRHAGKVEINQEVLKTVNNN